MRWLSSGLLIFNWLHFLLGSRRFAVLIPARGLTLGLLFSLGLFLELLSTLVAVKLLIFVCLIFQFLFLFTKSR